MARVIVPLDFGSYTITDTAGDLFSFADSGSPSEMPTGARCFKGRLETATIRVRMDETIVSSSVGELIAIGDDMLLDQNIISAASFIRTGGTSGVLQGHFYQNEADVFVGGG